jgi:hypothetical protein
MKHRKLRIAWSVAWGIAAVLLVVLWVRSYSGVDGFLVPRTNSCGLRLASFHGRIGGEPDDTATEWRWLSETVNLDGFDWVKWDRATPRWILKNDGTISVPHWFPISIAGILSAAQWLPRRFTVRTLLIATTLVAVGLGLIVWLSR